MSRLICSAAFLSIWLIHMVSCQAQTPSTIPKKPAVGKGAIVGGGIEGGELMYVGMPKEILPFDTSPGWTLPGPKLKISGTIYKEDGKTPAAGVIMYYYQTDHRGYYSDGPGLDREAVRHGHIRGWVKTGADGKYTIWTLRPAPYPNARMAAHIHPIILEPHISQEYYIDEFVFDDDSFLNSSERAKLENRGGSGILKVRQEGGLQVAERNITLGLNIPNYPR